MAPVIKALEQADGSESVVCVTAQHRKMLDEVLDIFEIQPQYDLNIMKCNQTLCQITESVLNKFQEVLKSERPDVVLVHGDTTTSMAASLTAYYQKILVGHVEAGLRTYCKYAPYPEELNRHIIDVIADCYFAPTDIAKENLLKENVREEKIFVTGNTVVDALLFIKNKINNDLELNKRLKQKFSFLDTQKRLILVTGHRRENFGKGFQNICLALKEIAERYDDVQILYPVHLNPNVRNVIEDMIGKINANNKSQKILLIDPVDYISFIYLMDKSYLVLTDSGGIQEEAPSFGKPVLVMREVTERPEGVNAGIVRLVGTSKEKIVKETVRLLETDIQYEEISKRNNPYGDGHASEKIVKIIRRMEI